MLSYDPVVNEKQTLVLDARLFICSYPRLLIRRTNDYHAQSLAWLPRIQQEE